MPHVVWLVPLASGGTNKDHHWLEHQLRLQGEGWATVTCRYNYDTVTFHRNIGPGIIFFESDIRVMVLLYLIGLPHVTLS